MAKLLTAGAEGKAAHLHTDDFYVYIRKGYIEPWLPTAHGQNTTIMEAASESAMAYARGGYFTVVDGIVGPWFLPPFRERAARDGIAIDYVVLRPSKATAISRGVAREERGAMRDEKVIAQMWDHFADLGVLERHALDNGGHTTIQTAEAILNGLAAGTFRLA